MTQEIRVKFKIGDEVVYRNPAGAYTTKVSAVHILADGVRYDLAAVGDTPELGNVPEASLELSEVESLRREVEKLRAEVRDLRSYRSGLGMGLADLAKRQQPPDKSWLGEPQVQR